MPLKTLKEEQKSYIERVALAVDNAKTKFKISQDEIADAIGVEHSTLANYKSHRPMPQKYLKRFCEKAKVRVEWLVHNRGNMYDLPWIQTKLDLLHSLNETEQKQFDAMLEILFPTKPKS